jgi:hypothetical protein
MRVVSLVLMTVVALAAGCDRTHMSKAYGQATRAAFKAQVINPSAGDRRAPEQGLDPEEAATVAKSYRDSLSPKSTSDQSRAPLIVLPQTAPGGAPPPAPGAVR